MAVAQKLAISNLRTQKPFDRRVKNYNILQFQPILLRAKTRGLLPCRKFSYFLKTISKNWLRSTKK